MLFCALCRDGISTLSNSDIIHSLWIEGLDTSRIFKLYIILHFGCNLSNIRCCEISRLYFVMHSSDVFINYSFSAKHYCSQEVGYMSIVSLPEIILPEHPFWHKNGWTLIKHLCSPVCRLLRKSITTQDTCSNIVLYEALTVHIA